MKLELSEQIGSKYFYFQKMNVIDALQIQQAILQKIKVDSNLLSIIDDIGKEDNDDIGGFFMAFVSIIQGFDKVELVNFITEVIEKANVKVEGSQGKTLVSLNRDFEDDFNKVFFLLFHVLKANYNFDFFLQNSATKVKTEAVKMKRGEHLSQ